MDTIDIKTKAETLKALLARYAPQSDAALALQGALTPYIESALAGTMSEPVDWRQIPGARTFEETEARDLPGLEHAYAQFKIAITGGEPLALKMLRQQKR